MFGKKRKKNQKKLKIRSNVTMDHYLCYNYVLNGNYIYTTHTSSFDFQSKNERNKKYQKVKRMKLNVLDLVTILECTD